MSLRRDRLRSAVAELDADEVERLVGEMLESPDEMGELFEAIREGTAEVVHRYEEGQYFIADLIMAGALYSEAVSRAVERGGREPVNGRVVCGVVRGDIHELGKNVIVGMLEYNGYDVADLGVDVTPETFVDTVRRLKPDTLLLSGVLDTSFEQMERTLQLLERSGLRDCVRVLLGGPCVCREQCSAAGADGYIENLVDCLSLCERGGEKVLPRGAME